MERPPPLPYASHGWLAAAVSGRRLQLSCKGRKRRGQQRLRRPAAGAVGGWSERPSWRQAVNELVLRKSGMMGIGSRAFSACRQSHGLQKPAACHFKQTK